MDCGQISVEDYVAIANMMGEYQYLVDEGDEEGWAALFTEDGAFFGLPDAFGPPESFRGREGLKQIPRITNSFGGKFRHFMGSFSVRYGQTTNEAFARYYVLATNWQKQGAERLEMFTLVKTHLVRVDGRWKIKSNTMSVL